MINKLADSVAQALAGLKDGATVLIGGFGTAGIPGELIDGLIAQGVSTGSRRTSTPWPWPAGSTKAAPGPWACGSTSSAAR